MRIGIIGPESTGKSSLGIALSRHFDGIYVAEYARTYLSRKVGRYTYEDVVAITRKMLEDLYGRYDKSIIFFDTELIINKIWFEYVYHRVPDFLTEALSRNPIDYYLLCAPDIPAVEDSLRENLDKREYFFDLYREEVLKTDIPYSIITSNGAERIYKAIKAIDYARNHYQS